MDLSKAYDSIPHDFVIAKLRHMVLIVKFFYSYFSNRKQRVKTGSATSEWTVILTGIL